MNVLFCLQKTVNMCGRFMRIIKNKTDDPEIDDMAHNESTIGVYVKNEIGTLIPLTSKHLKVCSKTTDVRFALCDGITLKMMPDKFGWKEIGGCYILYFTREINGRHESFVSVKMAELQLLSYYLNYLHSCLYKWASVRSYFMTEYESSLLNEINKQTSDENDGSYLFLAGIDCVIKLIDLEEFYSFLKSSFQKILYNDTSHKCGFLCINRKTVVSYCTIGDKKLIPTFYFDEKIAKSMTGAVQLEGWNLAYIKFCCTIQQESLKYDVFSADSCTVASLEVIRKYHSPNTIFEEYWPIVMVENYFLSHSTYVNKPNAWIIMPSSANEVTNKSKTPVNIPDQGMNGQHVCKKRAFAKHYLAPNLYAELEFEFIPKIGVMDGKHNKLYKIKKMPVGDIISKCINFEPNSDVYMVVLEELLQKHCFPCNVYRGAFICNKLLKMRLYLPNDLQMKVLDKNMYLKFHSIKTTVLVKFNDVIHNFEQLNIMMRAPVDSIY